MPPRFGWWTDSGVWLPLGADSRDTQAVFPITRLKPEVSPAAAEQRLHAIQMEFPKANPSGFPRDVFTSQLANYLDITVASGTMQRSLRLLFGAVGFLLLIACANVANLQLAKATARTREMAIRLSMGARRGQLVRQLLTENVLVSLLGGLLGLLFAYWITQLMVALMPTFFVPNEARIEVNRYVLLFCVAVSALTGILFGLAPALQSSRPDLVTALKDDARGSGASAGGRTRALLVVIEVALSVVLLVSAGLTIRSFAALQQVDLGFRPERVMAVALPLPPRRYATWEQRNRFAQELLERVKSLPGVQAATIGVGGLPFGGPQSTFALDSHATAETRRITMSAVSADYLSVLGIPLRQGRMLTERACDGGAHGLLPAGAAGDEG
ncbi:MAG: FtsX-like permease family protein [Blastocatellia bacterium]